MTSITNFSKYLIYNNGDVYSIKNKKILKKRFDKDGYPRIDLQNDNKKKITFHIHKLVAIAYLNFIPAPNLTIDHIDHNKTNNYLHNLQICTRAQNIMRKRCINKINGLPKGVYKSKKLYNAIINIDKKKIIIGTYENADLAHDAYMSEVNKIMKDIIY